MRNLMLLAGTTALVAAGLGGCAASGSTAAKDVSISACTASPTGGHPSVTGRILNHSSKSSVYTIHVTFTDSSGNHVGDGVAGVAKVDPGTSATWRATGTLDAKGPVKCTLSSVTRNATP